MDAGAALVMFVGAPIIALVRSIKKWNAKKRVFGVVLPPELVSQVSAALETVRKCHIIQATRREDESDVAAIVRLKKERNDAVKIFKTDKILFVGTSRIVVGRMTAPERVFTFVGSLGPAVPSGGGAAMGGAGSPNMQVVEAIRAAEDGTGVYAISTFPQMIEDILEAVALNRLL